MTRKEAWNRIDAIIEKHEVDDVYVTINNHKDYDALRFARKLLEQEPCEDVPDINVGECKECQYYINPDYTRCHECKAESEDRHISRKDQE